MKKHMLIMNIISLVCTFALLILVTFAWYATNKTAEATGGSGVTASFNVEATLTRYLAVEKENNTYSKGSEIKSKNDVHLYTTFPGESYDKIIYEFAYKSDNPTVSISMKCNGNRNNKFTVEGNEYKNYLSNVASFQMLNISSGIVDSEEYALGYYKVGETPKTVNFPSVEANSSETKYFYLLMDYSIDSVNRLFSDNLGLSEYNLYFTNDISFYIS